MRSRHVVRRHLAIGLIASVGLLSSCGGGDDDGISLITPPDEGSQATAAPATDGGDSGGDSGGIIDLPGVPEGCLELAKALEQAFGGLGGEGAPANAMEMFGALADAMEELKGVLPSEFSADLDLLAEGYRVMDEVLAEYDYDMMQAFTDPEAMEKLQILDDEEFIAAGERLGAYVDEKCPSS